MTHSESEVLEKNPRKADHDVNPLMLNRWSPRAMSGEEISDEDLMRLFEAARWAPSSYNGQPWRFIYAKRNTQYWDSLFNLMATSNQTWAKNAAVLVVIISRKNFEFNEKPSITHQFDSGSAWENLALQAETQQLVTHAMQGFDYQKAREVLAIPDSFDVMAMVAIGKPAPKDSLPSELQQMEAPSDRKPLSELIMEGRFRI
ncbi:MAG: nitroreductase family protein [Nitrososphaeraceae archaeon]